MFEKGPYHYINFHKNPKKDFFDDRPGDYFEIEAE